LKNFGGYSSGFEHEGFRAVLQGCFGHADCLRRGRCVFSSLRASGGKHPILNLEQVVPLLAGGRGMIFYVADVDAFWEYLRGKGFNPESSRDASWVERCFHMRDPNGHELSFARPI
jgi:uncharacterized glyoxalase superfamily protein PhnB